MNKEELKEAQEVIDEAKKPIPEEDLKPLVPKFPEPVKEERK